MSWAQMKTEMKSFEPQRSYVCRQTFDLRLGDVNILTLIERFPNHSGVQASLRCSPYQA